MRDYLKKMRERENLSQNQVANLIGISQNYYSMIETGKRQKKISMEMAQKLADVFGVPLAYIWENDNKST